jgi:hypothetical protein
VIVGWDQASTGLRRAVQWRERHPELHQERNAIRGRGPRCVARRTVRRRRDQFATNGEAWRYTPSTGVERLGLLPGQDGGVTNGISDDHEVITGYATGT